MTKSLLMIVLSKLCNEDWNRMSPAEKGRYCGKCAKVITDFSAMTDEELAEFLRSHSKENICGRFHIRQLTPPAVAARVRTERHRSRYRVFFAALLLVFGAALFSSCGKDGISPGKQVIIETRHSIPQEGSLDTSVLPLSRNGFLIPIPDPEQTHIDTDIIEVAGVEPIIDYPDTSIIQ